MPEKRDHLSACAQAKCFKGISEIVKDYSSHKLRYLEMQNSFEDFPGKNLFREESWRALWAQNYRICFLVFSLKVPEGAL